MSISVLICCYNGERFLAETLESVLAQTLKPAEVIVIDDGSTDRSAEIAESFGLPVRVIRQANKGLPASRNVAIHAAQGKYLMFIDADDLLHPEALERLHGGAESSHDSVAIMGYASFIKEVDKPIVTKMFDGDNFFPDIIHGNFGPQHNRLIPRELVLRAGCFDPTMYLFEDWLFWCRVALCDARLAPVKFVGAFYRRHGATMSYTAPRIASLRGHVRVMEELSSGMLQRPDLLGAYGDLLFWACLTAVRRARRQKIEWSELARLTTYMRRIVAHGPRSLRGSRYAAIVRLIGVHWAERIHSLAGGTAQDAEVEIDPMRQMVAASLAANE